MLMAFSILNSIATKFRTAIPAAIFTDVHLERESRFRLEIVFVQKRMCWKDGKSPRVSSNNMDYLTAILLMGTNMLIYFALSKRLMTIDCQVSIYDAVSGQNVQVFKSHFILRDSSAQSASAPLKKPDLSLESIPVLYYNDHFGMARDVSHPTTWPPWSGRAGRRGRPWKDGKVHSTLTVPSILPNCALDSKYTALKYDSYRTWVVSKKNVFSSSW